MAAHGAAFGCREVAFGCTGAVYGSDAADMQYMLHLAGPGWGPGRERTLTGVVNCDSRDPNPSSRMGDQPSRMNHLKDQG